MNEPYRDERESLRAKARDLEEQLATRDREVEALRCRLGDQDAVFVRLESALGDRRPTRAAWTVPLLHGHRSPWFTVTGGAIYVHGVGDFLPGDVGTTKLTLFDVMVKGEEGGYTLARGGRSLLEVTRSDRDRIAGRFEADVSKVADVTREPAFGTPVVRMRGTFCLPALPANPRDTGP